MNSEHTVGALEEFKKDEMQINKNTMGEEWRSTSQSLLPAQVLDADRQKVDDYILSPFQALGDHKIFNGYTSLAEWIISEKTVVIDGYIGVFFHDVQLQIQKELDQKGLSVKWHQAIDYLKPEKGVDELVKPFLGGEDEVWGTKCNLNLQDFFKSGEFLKLNMDPEKDINIVIGIGAGLLNREAPVIYLDIPKNEIQYRMRARSIANLGKSASERSFSMYKRFYFVDWEVLNRYRAELLARISIVGDGQRLHELNWLFKADLLKGLDQLSHTVLRARPWFESGSWGGQWMKSKLKGLNVNEVNYAWSFELISPENGLVFESDGNLLEVSFDFLMLCESQAVLGKHAETFGAYFPIRFDFLDTFDGGNLSIQCHPSKNYIRANFGETITQDETYYILDAAPGAKVYLGFQDDINPAEFRLALENSQLKNEEIAIEKYVRSFPSVKHELFLIPNGTVHSSGRNNMVLEISATPYIFTFKMYDWLSLDLHGNPRPINIAHAFNNLRFERKGKLVEQELISIPVSLEKGADWELIHLPTHKDHFYDVHRLEFDTEMTVATEDSCHVLMLVEGTTVAVEINGKPVGIFHYAETFVIPAATQNYKLLNPGKEKLKVIKAFLKNEIQL